MILNRTLTAEERRISQRCIEAFNFGNGMSYMCLGESILVLFAARLGAPNAVVALLGAMQYLGYAMLPLGVWRTAVRGAAASQSGRIMRHTPKESTSAMDSAKMLCPFSPRIFVTAASAPFWFSSSTAI